MFSNCEVVIIIIITEVCCDLVVTWVTFDPTDVSQVKYTHRGSAIAPTVVTGTMTKFVDDGDEHVVRYIHRAELTNLSAHSSYGKVNPQAIANIVLTQSLRHPSQSSTIYLPRVFLLRHRFACFRFLLFQCSQFEDF